jgi:tetratricopeptide (TPR) repeat protein
VDQFAAAEDVYRAFVSQSKRPEGTLELAGFLSRRNRVTEALDLCEAAWATCPPDQVAATIVAILYTVKKDENQFSRAERALDTALQKNPQIPALLFQVGNFRSIQGRYREAIGLYRKSVALDQNSSGSLNNLAWLLALEDHNAAEALAVVNRAIEVAGPTAGLLDTRAVAYIIGGQSSLAIQDLLEVTAQSPSASVFFHLAQAYAARNDLKAASDALQKAKALGLEANKLHPLERAAYQRLLGQLASR